MRFSRYAPFLLFVLFLQSAIAQQSSLSLNSPSPAPVTGVSASVVGNTGNATYYYFVVGTYPIGNAAPSNAAFVGQAPSVLSASNSVRVSWSAITGVSSYTLLRTTTPNLPAACAACKLTTMAGTTYNDIGSSLTSYAVTTAPGASSQITLDNQSASAPFLNYVLANPTPIIGLFKVPIFNGTMTPGNCVQVGALPGQLVQASAACGSGGGGTPGGTTGQIQYNNAGAFGGFTAGGDAAIVPSTGVVTVTGLNGTSLASLATGLLFNTAGTITSLGTSGTGNVARVVSPTFTTPALGTPSAVVLTNATGLPPAGVTSAQGTGAKFQFSTGTATTGHCVQFDATGNTVDAGAACGTSTGGITALTGDGAATGPGSAALTVTGLNGTSLAGLASGLLFNTTATGVPSIATGSQIASFLSSANIVGLFTGCSGTLYLGADGACHASTTGTVTSVGFTGGLISVATPTTTPAFTVAGTSGGMPYFNSASTWATTAALASGQFILGGGAGVAPSTSFSVVPVVNGGTATGSTLTGIVRGGNPFTASELSGDAITSGSNAVTVQRLNGATIPLSAAVLSSNASNQLVASAVQGNGLKAQLSTGTTTTNDCVKFDANGNTVDAGAACGSGGGSGGGTSGWSGITLSLLANATQFTPSVGGALPSTTETVVSLPANAAATLSHLSVTLSASLGTGTTLAVTLEDGTATPTALTCTTASGGTTCVDNTHSVSVALGDLLSFKIVATGTVTAATPEVVIGYAVGTSGVGVTSVTGTTPIVSSGGTTPAISCATCTTNAAALTSTNVVTGAGGQATQASPVTINQTTGTIATPGGVSTGTAATATGYQSFSGLTSGLNGFTVPNIAGTSSLLMLPATAGTAGQQLVNTGSVTCPTLPSGAPSTCYQLLWATPTVVQLSSTGAICTTPCPVVTASSATSVTFTGIPSTYTNLVLKGLGRSQGAGTGADSVLIQFNGVTTSVYQQNCLFANTTSGVCTPTGSTSIQVFNFPQASITASYPGGGSLEIPGYAQTTFFKPVSGLSSYAFGTVTPSLIDFSGYWASTSAITSITLTLPSSTAFVNGSMFSLYAFQ